MINLKNVIFYDHINKNICDLRNIIKLIKIKKINIQFKYKKIINQEMKNININNSIDNNKFMIKQLIMKKEKNKDYIIKEII